MKKDNSTFSCPAASEEQFEVKKQGYVSIQERKVFQTWKKVWLVFKLMTGSTPRVVFDAYGHEYQFRSGLAPKYTFNLTGTVTPVVICQQNHRQVRHMFAVCPPGSRYLFECDSQFGLESWVEELNECLFPRSNPVDHMLDNLSTSLKLTGSLRHRTKSNSMNNISKIGSEAIPEIPVAPPLPPPNKKAVVGCTTSSPTRAVDEVVSGYRVEVEVSTLSQIPKGVCVVTVGRQDIKLCHAVTMECQVAWHITHIREFKLTNDQKLIITSGNRSATGYGQIRLQGEECRNLYYKVKIFVQSNHVSKQITRTAVTLPDRQRPPLPSSVRSADTPRSYMTSPPQSPPVSNSQAGHRDLSVNYSRPLPRIPVAHTDSHKYPDPTEEPDLLEYSKLRHGDWTTGNFKKSSSLETNPFTQPTEYCVVNQNESSTDTSQYDVTQHNLFQGDIGDEPDSISPRKSTSVCVTVNPAYDNTR
eukprot:TRINITY_DN3021_c0_g1_i3.p1 TRINITY_DN3021_c0_g1~~TRINITY_DN3021_c0_g1_i3.p1  ORF type:complete len:472 (-),score=113.27 TRINITY_DN3021_c0_g1_i3:72-1487(-)